MVIVNTHKVKPLLTIGNGSVQLESVKTEPFKKFETRTEPQNR